MSESVNWIHLALERNRWWALVIVVMNYDSIKRGQFLYQLSDFS